MARAAVAVEHREGGLRIAARVVTAVFANYWLTLSAAQLLAVALARGGMARAEAVALASMPAYLFYLVVLLWAFHERRLGRVWLVVAGGAAIAYGLTRWLAAGLPAWEG